MRKKRELFFGIAAAMVFAASMSVYAEQEEETQGDTQMQTESLVASADEMARRCGGSRYGSCVRR